MGNDALQLLGRTKGAAFNRRTTKAEISRISSPLSVTFCRTAQGEYLSPVRPGM
jgi:hypothetical protein